jgi:hypothetical protein
MYYLSIIGKKGFLLINGQEMLLFIKELGHLLSNYKEFNIEETRQKSSLYSTGAKAC